MSSVALRPSLHDLRGVRLRLVGAFGGVSRREAAAAIERRGGVIDEVFPDLIVVGEEASELEHKEAAAEALRLAAECVGETDLWRRLGLLEGDEGVRRLYSPRMLSELVGVPLVVVRRWSRNGLLRPTCWVNRLAYFDFEEARVAHLLSDAYQQGGSLSAVEGLVDRLNRSFPHLARPLSELALVVVDGALMLRSDDDLLEATGQRRLDFTSAESPQENEQPLVLLFPNNPATPAEALRERAWRLHSEGDATGAIAAWRLAMLDSEPDADDHFTLAEWLGANGQPEAAKERYFASLELEADHLEARVGLAGVLCELGDFDGAAAAASGAIDQHEDYADAHFQLAKALEHRGDRTASEAHWRRFLEIAPEGPRAEEARRWLGC